MLSMSQKAPSPQEVEVETLCFGTVLFFCFLRTSKKTQFLSSSSFPQPEHSRVFKHDNDPKYGVKAAKGVVKEAAHLVA